MDYPIKATFLWKHQTPKHYLVNFLLLFFQIYLSFLLSTCKKEKKTKKKEKKRKHWPIKITVFTSIWLIFSSVAKIVGEHVLLVWGKLNTRLSDLNWRLNICSNTCWNSHVIELFDCLMIVYSDLLTLAKLSLICKI